jgi:hypothetical protein
MGMEKMMSDKQSGKSPDTSDYSQEQLTEVFNRARGIE